jgi:hypothetical protein
LKIPVLGVGSANLGVKRALKPRRLRGVTQGLFKGARWMKNRGHPASQRSRSRDPQAWNEHSLTMGTRRLPVPHIVLSVCF